RGTGVAGVWRRSQSRLPPLTLRQDLVAGLVLAGDLHAPLFDECAQQGIQGLHQVPVSVDLVRAELLDPAHAVFLDVAGDDAGERAPQVGGELVRRAVAVQVERSHRLVAGHERLLEPQRYVQRPVEEERVLLLDPELAYAIDAARHLARDLGRVVDDDAVARSRRITQGQAQELVDLLEVRRGRGRP